MAQVDVIVRLLTELQAQVAQLSRDVAQLQATVERQQAACDKMGSHIDFVENVYDTVRAPLNYVTQRLSWRSGHSAELPQLTHKGDADNEC